MTASTASIGKAEPAMKTAEGVAVRKLPEQLVVWDEPLPRTASGKVVWAQLVMRSPAKHNELAARLREP